MTQLGYEGVLLQRRDDQGLATFWHSSTFQMVAHKHATLHHVAETHLQVGVIIHVVLKTLTYGWRRGVLVTELVVSTKLLYVEPG